jgi:hypothetical protein
VFDTWENRRALREGYQPWMSYSTHGEGHLACLRVDARGKVYIAAAGGPKGVVPGRKGRRLRNYYNSTYGSIIRLDLDERWAKDMPLPAGAPPADPEERKKGIQWSTGMFLPRVEKCYAGVMSWVWAGCTCRTSTFDLDEHGRLYIPDAGRESLVVLDNAGNEILRVRKTVAAGPGGKGMAIHVGWPHRVACTRKAIYFGEGLSMRVIRIGLGYAAEETCRIP